MGGATASNSLPLQSQLICQTVTSIQPPSKDTINQTKQYSLINAFRKRLKSVTTKSYWST